MAACGETAENVCGAVVFLSVSSLRFRALRTLRRVLRLDRERRWNAEYACGTWSRLGALDELAHQAVLASYFARLKPGGSVLDVGCGEGLFQRELRGCYSRYLGIDFAEPVRLASAQRDLRMDTRAEFVATDMHDFTTSERFDAVVFNESLYYYDDAVRGLARYAEFLAPHGVLLISMHTKERTERLWDCIAERYSIIDSVMIENRRRVQWTIKVLAPQTD